MNYNYSCLLIIVATFVTFAGVNAATLSGNSYLDDSGTIYISTVDTSQGVQVATTTLWSNPANFTGYTLADDVDYFIHVFVKGGNYPNNIIGEFNISDTTHEFANGTQMLGTNKVDWKWGTSWASMGNTPFNVGNNFAGSFALTTENIFRANTWPDYINTSAYFTASIFAVPDPTTYWRGQTDGTWTNANWASDAAGNPAATIPSNTSDVIFSATGAANQNTTLGADFTINSLTVNDTAAVTIGGANTLTINGDNAITVNSGAGLFTINSNLTLGGTAPTITVNNSPGMIVNGVIDGSAGLIKDGTGTLTLTGVNTYTGGTTISGGTLQIGNGGTSGSIAGNVTNNANITFNRSDALSFGGIISGTGSLTKQGAGTLTLTGANTYSGGTTISGGTLQVNTNNALGTNAAGTSVTSGAAFALNNVNYTTAEALTINGTGISNGGALANIGTSSYAGQITAATNATINAGGGALTLTGGLVKNGTTLTLTGGGTINVNTVGISGALANSDLIVDSATVNLNVANTYNGPTFIRSTAGAGLGILNTNAANALPTAIGRTALTMDDSGLGSSQLNLIGGFSQSVASLTGAASSLINLNGNTLTIGTTAGSTDFAGVISGSGGLTKDGDSTQILSGGNTYTGATAVNVGALWIDSNNALGTNAVGTTVANGATLVLNGVTYSTTEALTINGAGVMGGGALANIGTSSYAGQITAATNATINAGGGALTLTGGLVKNGTTLTLTGGGTININTVGISGALANSDLIVNGVTTNLNVANTYNGPTFIRSIGAGDGILNANVTNALPTNRTALTMDDSGAGGSRLNLGANQSIASLAGASTSLVDLHANTLTIGDAASSTDFAGVISGTGGLTKDGASTQTLSGANTYTGTTRVTAGLLELSSAGRLASGSSIDIQGGTLTFVGSESVANFSQSAGIMDFDATHPGGVLAGCQLTPGVHNDTLTVSTSTTLGGTINVNKDGGAEFQRGERAVLIDSGPANITGLPATFTHDYTNRNFLVVDNSTGLVTMLGSGVAGQNSNLVGIADLTPNQVGIANAINTNISGNGNILDASVEADQMALLLIGDCNTPPLAGYSLASPESYAGLVDYGTQSIKSYTTAALSMPGFSLDSTAKSVRIPVGTASDPEMMPSTSSKGITSVFAGYSNYSTGTDSSINGADYDISSHGGILGVRHNINRLTLGGFLAVDEGDINSSTLSADADGFLLGAFASYLLKPENNLIITGGITYGDYEYGGTRQSLGLVTFDDVGSEAFDIHLSIEGDVYSTSKVRVTPFLGVQYINSDTDGFTETGLGALSISRQTQDAFFSDLGVKAEYQFNEQLSLNGNMSYTYNFNDSDKNVGAGLGGTPFAVSSPGLGDDFLTIGVGAQYQVNEALRVGVNYRAEFSDDSDVANGVNIGGSYSF